MDSKELNEWKIWAEEYEKNCEKEKKNQVKNLENVDNDDVNDEHNN